MAISFQSPPVYEVVFSSYFTKPLNGFRSEHVGRFWETIKDEFPSVEQQIPLDVYQGFNVPQQEEDETFPMPRYCFVGKDGASLLQIQKNAVMFNWRRNNGNAYPRYEKIKPLFDCYHRKFVEFINEIDAPSTTNKCELAYVNLIEQCEFWNAPSDTPNVIPCFSMLPAGHESHEKIGFNCEYTYVINSRLSLVVNMRTVAKKGHPSERGLIFEIKASESIEENMTYYDWFSKSHEAINKCFLAMTSQEVQQQYWRPE